MGLKGCIHCIFSQKKGKSALRIGWMCSRGVTFQLSRGGVGGLCRNSNWATIDHTATPATWALHLQTKHTIFQGLSAGSLKQDEKSIIETNNTPWGHISACYIH